MIYPLVVKSVVYSSSSVVRNPTNQITIVVVVLSEIQPIKSRLKTSSKTLSVSVQTPERGLDEVVRWTGCAGSQSNYRGYTCGLWNLFHTLTVSAHTDRK